MEGGAVERDTSKDPIVPNPHAGRFSPLAEFRCSGA